MAVIRQSRRAEGTLTAMAIIEAANLSFAAAAVLFAVLGISVAVLAARTTVGRDVS